MARQNSLAPLLAQAPGSGRVRSPKASELVARTLRQMIVDGELHDGDHLPPESELTTHFQVSRPTLREAVRLLEADGLVELRRGSRLGAQVHLPGPESVARPAGLVLEISGATLADVMAARIAIEPAAARTVAESGTQKARKELRQLASGMPEAWMGGQLASASANFHRRLVELSGNPVLAMFAGMLHEIAERHTATAVRRQQNTVSKELFGRLTRSFDRLVDLIDARDGKEAEAHWHRHMQNAGAELLRGYEKTKVRDIMG
jgi:GntR family transcriptional regulator, transcriptional repressor for pyruvate dehydrogenase complex